MEDTSKKRNVSSLTKGSDSLAFRFSRLIFCRDTCEHFRHVTEGAGEMREDDKKPKCALEPELGEMQLLQQGLSHSSQRLRRAFVFVPQLRHKEGSDEERFSAETRCLVMEIPT